MLSKQSRFSASASTSTSTSTSVHSSLLSHYYHTIDDIATLSKQSRFRVSASISGGSTTSTTATATTNATLQRHR